MTKKLTIIIALSTVFFANGQVFQGKAEYFSKRITKTKIKEAKSKEDEEFDKLFQDAIKKASENKYTLTFNNRECLYEKNQELEKPETIPTDGSSITLSFSSEGVKYINTKDKLKIVEDEIFGKEFLKVDTLQNLNWKLIDEIKKIGEYNCFKAEITIPVTEIEKNEYKDFLKRQEKKKTSGFFDMTEPKDKIITAWYAPEIPVSFGPNNYWGLPGLILEIDEDESVTLCTKIALNNKDVFKIKIPSNGKKVSTAEFEKIRKAKSDSMKNEDGVIIFSEEK